MPRTVLDIGKIPIPHIILQNQTGDKWLTPHASTHVAAIDNVGQMWHTLARWQDQPPSLELKNAPILFTIATLEQAGSRAPVSINLRPGRFSPLLTMFKVAAGVLAGASFFTLVGPVVGEMIATFPPIFPREADDALAEFGLPYEDVAFPTADGLTLRGWFIPAGQPDAPAIVYAPATAQDQRSGLDLIPAFHRAGYHVLLFSYRGYGRSDGKKGAFTYGEAESKDVDAAVEFLSEAKQIRRIGVIGYSVGAVSAILSAARNEQIGAVVAVAPFNCVSEVWQTSRPSLVPPALVDWALWVAEKRGGFDASDVCPIDVVDRIAPRPLLVIRGTKDRRVTQAQVLRFFQAAQEPKSLWLVKGVTHQGIRTVVLDQLAPQVVAFFDAAWRGQGEPAPAVANRWPPGHPRQQ
jgi:alpha-beta hydrolase superfamily lysophospholipase